MVLQEIITLILHSIGIANSLYARCVIFLKKYFFVSLFFIQKRQECTFPKEQFLLKKSEFGAILILFVKWCAEVVGGGGGGGVCNNISLKKTVRVGGGRRRRNSIKINHSYWFNKKIIPKELRKHKTTRLPQKKYRSFELSIYTSTI